MKNIDDIYGLSPLQQGILFHSLFAPQSGVYIIQSSLALEGIVHAKHLQTAWQQVLDHHAVLRSSFNWQHTDEPIQVVHRQVKVPIEEQDWRQLPKEEQRDNLQFYFKADRHRGFDLSKAPLMRLALIRMSDEDYHFIWTFHHLLLDGWSSNAVFQDCASIYNALCHGRTLNPGRSRPYRDYIIWLQRQDLLKAETFWRHHLSGFAVATPLGMDRAVGKPNQEEHYGEQRIELSPVLTTELQSFARQNHLTLNTLIQGAWALLLSYYSGDGDIVFGVTVSGRPPNLPGTETIVGLFINTLPLRVKVSLETPLLLWLKELQATQFAMRQFEYSPLTQVQGWSDVPRGEPLFESIFIFENYHLNTSQTDPLHGIRIRKACSYEKTSYPLTVVAEPSTTLALRMLHDCRRFEAETIKRMLGHFRTLLESMVLDPGQSLSNLRALTEREQSQMLIEWNNTKTAYPHERCFHELFEEQVEKTPDAIAAVFQDEQITYKELNRRANQLAHYLHGLGVGPDMLVALYVERSLEMVIGVLGILKAGAAYLPLDPAYPEERISFMLEDAQAAVLLTVGRLARQIPECIAEVICLDQDWTLSARQDERNLKSGATAENLAYVIYTSGSTGKPKGALLSHRGLCNVSEAQKLTFGVEPGDCVLQFSSFSFDASTFEMAMALSAGAKLCLGSQAELLPGPALIRFLREQQIGIVTLPPSALSASSVAQLPELKSITVAGEACSIDLVRHWANSRRFFNLYGPTETTIWATASEYSDGGQTPHIGLPIANTQVFLLNQRLQLVPAGVPGELYIGGVGLARGYLNRPELTAERFLANPFSQEPGARLYKSGDLGRRLPDGNIEFLGRRDDQVKIRGFRIELGEIGTVLDQHPGVRESVVTSRPDASGSSRIIAYIVPSRQAAPTTTELRRFLQQKLPDYMLPAVFVALSHLPLTPAGKVNRKALPEPDGFRPDLATAFVAPQTKLEQIIANIWQEVLQVKEVGMSDNFFDLGGHSLLVIQIQNRLRDSLDRDLAISDLFKHPTVSSLARFMGDEPADAVAAQRQQDEELKKLTEGKKRLQLQDKMRSLKVTH